MLVISLFAAIGCGRVGFEGADGGPIPGDAGNDLGTNPDGQVGEGGMVDGPISDSQADGDGFTPGACAAPVALNDLAAEIAAVLCDLIGRLESIEPFPFGPDCDSALTSLLALPEVGLTALIDAVDQGRIAYDPAAAAECVCADVGFPFVQDLPFAVSGGACADAFQGTLPLGSPCQLDLECAADAYCAIGGECGTCTARRPLGASCERSAECERSDELVALCDFRAASPTCLGFSIQANASVGAPCNELVVMGTSATTGVCAEGLGCDVETSVCVVPPAEGETCNELCASGLTCSADTCRPVSYTGTEGDACDDDHDAPAGMTVQGCDFSTGLVCAMGVCECVSGTCPLELFAPVGASCAGFGFCDRTGFCNRSSVCEARQVVGTMCEDSEQCASGSCADGLCVPYCAPQTQRVPSP